MKLYPEGRSPTISKTARARWSSEISTPCLIHRYGVQYGRCSKFTFPTKAALAKHAEVPSNLLFEF
jgi:hypothetical protein